MTLMLEESARQFTAPAPVSDTARPDSSATLEKCDAAGSVDTPSGIARPVLQSDAPGLAKAPPTVADRREPAPRKSQVLRELENHSVEKRLRG